ASLPSAHDVVMIFGLTCALPRQLSTTGCAAAAADPARVRAAAEVGAAPAGPTIARLRPSPAMANTEAIVVNLPRFMMLPRFCPAFLAYMETTRAGGWLRDVRMGYPGDIRRHRAPSEGWRSCRR